MHDFSDDKYKSLRRIFSFKTKIKSIVCNETNSINVCYSFVQGEKTDHRELKPQPVKQVYNPLMFIVTDENIHKSFSE